MKFLFLGLVVAGGGVGLWRLWIALQDYHDQFLSEGWRRAQDVQDAIRAGQYEGYVGWPWDGDDAA